MSDIPSFPGIFLGSCQLILHAVELLSHRRVLFTKTFHHGAKGLHIDEGLGGSRSHGNG